MNTVPHPQGPHPGDTGVEACQHERMSKIALIVATFALLGCGNIDSWQAEKRYRNLDAHEVYAPDCRIPLDVDPGLLEVTLAVAEQWSYYTGCAITVQEGGIPFRYSDTRGKPDGVATCEPHPSDPRRWKVLGVKFRRRLSGHNMHGLVVHEMHHILGRFGHGESGVGAPSVSADAVPDRPAIDAVCEKLDCPDVPLRW